MAKILNISSDEVKFTLSRLFQSGNINFIFGSGASFPAIPIAGDIEASVASLFDSGDEFTAYKLLYEFLRIIQSATEQFITGIPCAKKTGETPAAYKKRKAAIQTTLTNYENFIKALENILNERRTNILPKQANIFTTNYDLFFEQGSLNAQGIRLNDGFERTPSLQNKHIFSTKGFFNSVFNNGNLYNYKVEIPSLNLLKMHGSLSWKRNEEEIQFSSDIISEDIDDELEELQKFVKSFSLVLPQKSKFRETIMDRTYYDLLRLYANELDKENTVLLSFGFSFNDEHLFDITKRALKNPTLKLVIFAYDGMAVKEYSKKFDGFNNVDIVGPTEDETLGFEQLNLILQDIPGEKI